MAQDLFSKYLGKLEVEVGGEILQLDVRLKDKQKVMSLVSKFKDNITEETLGELTNIYLDILQRSYPDVPKEQFEAFLTQKFEEFMSGLAVAFGWTTKADMQRRMDETKK